MRHLYNENKNIRKLASKIESKTLLKKLPKHFDFNLVEKIIKFLKLTIQNK